jgi:tetratricopeptide (TPR) repeat protein
VTLKPGDIDYRVDGPVSGPADFWDLPADLQERLRQSYRELANRELKLGRCRRAAYIYAHLLSDPLSAAGALKQGRHHREAAVLYEEQLGNPLEAARCLAEGGLLEEAIRRYVKLERLAEAADLHEQLGNASAAAGLWRELVERARGTGDALAAARLLEERLGSPEEALQELAAAWPSSSQAVQCLGARFTLLGRLGRHDESLALVRALARGPRSAPTRQLGFLEVLREQALRHPDARLRREAADLCRVAGSVQLQDPSSTLWSATQVVDQLIQLAPHDRLLIRDANRHLSHRRAAEVQSGRSQEAHRRPSTSPRPGTDGQVPRLIRTFVLPPSLEWLAVRTESRWFYVLGGNEAQTRIVRGVWEGEFQSLPAGVSMAGLRRGFTLEPTAEGGRGLALYCPAEPPVARVVFPAADLFFSQECVVETPAWLPPRALPVTFGPSAAWSLHAAAGRVVLSSHDRSGDLLQTLDVSAELLPSSSRGVPAGPLCLAVLPQGVAMAADRRLLVLRPNGAFMRIELPSPAVRLFLSPAYARAGVGVAMRQGALVHWWGARDWVELDAELPEPLAAFLPGGPVLLASRGECRLVNADSRGVHHVTRFTAPERDLVAAVPAGEPGEFALFTRTGTVHVFAAPRE